MTGRRRYDVHGVVLDVSSSDAASLGLLDGRLLPWAGGAGGDGARDETGDGTGDGTGGTVTFRFLSGAEAPPPGPPGDRGGRPVYDLPTGQVLYFDHRDVLYVDHEGVAMVADLGAGVVDTWIRDVDHRARWLATHPFFTMAMVEVLKRRGLYSVHAAACAADGGNVVLLAGQSGAGKTTLALALARAGLGFLGDDTAFLAGRDATLHVLAFPDEVDVTDHTAQLLPELGHLLDRPKPEGAVKHRLRAEEVFGVPLVDVGRAAALVFPRVGDTEHAEPPTLLPITPDEALMELLPNVLLTEPTASQAHLDVLGQLALDTPAYRMTVGPDLDAAAAVLARLGCV